MNLTNLAASLRENMTTIEVFFTSREGGIHREKAYVYKCERFIADQLLEGDLVVVHAENSHNYKHMAIAQVARIHDEPDIDLEDKKTLKWVACKVPVEEVLLTQESDEEIGKQLRIKQAQNCRERALQMLGISKDEAKQLLGKHK